MEKPPKSSREMAPGDVTFAAGRRRMLVFFAWLFIVFALFWLTNFAVRRAFFQAAVLAALVFATGIIMFLLREEKISSRLFAHLISAELLFGIGFSDFYTGGLAGANVVPLFLVPVAALLMVGRSGIVWLFLTAMVGGAFELALFFDYHFPHLVVPEQRHADQIVTWLSTMIIITLAIFGYERIRSQQQAELLQAKAKAEEAARARSRFLAGMSHEFRTPLSHILANAGLLEKANGNGEVGERAAQIKKSSYALLGMVEDALDVARMESGQLHLFTAPFDPRAMVQDVMKQMSPRCEQKGLLLKMEAEGLRSEYVRGDSFRFRQILVNLVDNALKFTEKGSVTIRLFSEDDRWLRLEVEDTGPGVAEDMRERIFEAFVQGQPSITGVGTGLGLTICRNLSHALGGEITLKDAAGGGCCFVVKIPFPSWSRSGEAKGEGNILLVEDDAVGRELIETILRGSGYTVTSVADAARALVLANQANFSLMLVDVNLPGISGTDLVRHLRSSGGYLSSVPILALTAGALPEQRDECFRAGMNDFITKPVEVATVVAAVKKWLGDPSPAGRV